MAWLILQLHETGECPVKHSSHLEKKFAPVSPHLAMHLGFFPPSASFFN